MHIQVAALRTITSERTRHLVARDKQQSITEYAQQHITRRQTEIEQALAALVQHKKDISVPLFVTLPEFFWNIRWDALKNDEELHNLTECYLDQLPQRINTILGAFPKDKYGGIILLAGTVATLVETAQKGIYEALNYCLIGNNIRKIKSGSAEMSMWPKHHTSWVDFGPQVGESGDIIAYKLSPSLGVAVLKTSTCAPEHNTVQGYGSHIDNDMIKECPFSINICLDYTRLSASEQQNQPGRVLPLWRHGNVGGSQPDRDKL